MNHRCKRCVWTLASAAVIAADAMLSYSQTTAFGIRVTPSYMPGASVKNSSESNIYGPQGLNLNVGMYALKYFRSGPIGIKAALEYGAVPYIVGVDAPRSAFGTGAGGDKQINVTFNSNPLGFAAVTVSPTYKLSLGGRYVELSAGPSVRFYNYPEDGFMN